MNEEQQKKQSLKAANRIYRQAMRLEKSGINGHIIAKSMLQILTIQVILHYGRDKAAQWISDNVNEVLKVMKDKENE